MWITVKSVFVCEWLCSELYCFSFLLSLLYLPNEGFMFSSDTLNTQNSPLWEKYVHSKEFLPRNPHIIPKDK